MKQTKNNRINIPDEIDENHIHDLEWHEVETSSSEMIWLLLV